MEVRLIGTPPAALRAVPQEPTLEDGYLALVGPVADPGAHTERPSACVTQ
jgi:hypothetical protein